MAFKYIGGFVDEQTLRELRLYHWQAYLLHHAHVQNLRLHLTHEFTAWLSEKAGTKNEIKLKILELDKTANMHLGFVQTLNDFFPVDDTAEKDNVTA
jgi:hypothetical protein